MRIFLGVDLHGSVAKLSQRMRVRQATVSISHSAQYVVATAILLGAANERCATTSSI